MISKIITIDQSTSATKAMLFSESCELLHRVNIEHQQFYPQLGWVEHDAEEIYKNTIEAIHCLLEKEEVNGKDISYSLAITNQRETVVVWNKRTGKPVYHAVVWQCQRGAAICKELKDKDTADWYNGRRVAYRGEWKKLEVQFDAIYTGYLGSPRQIQIVSDFIKDFRQPDSLIVADPVLGDNGRLYTNFDMEMVKEMRHLITKADVITPI